MATVNFKRAPHLDQENLSQPVLKTNLGLSQGVTPAKTFQSSYATPRKALGNIQNTGLDRSGAGFRKPLSSINEHQSVRQLVAKDFKQNFSKPTGTTPLHHQPKRPKQGLSIRNADKQMNTNRQIYRQTAPMSQTCFSGKPKRTSLDHPLEKENMFPFTEPEEEYCPPAYLQMMTKAHIKEKLWPPYTVPVNRRFKTVFELDENPLDDMKPAMSEPSLLDAIAADLTGLDLSNLEPGSPLSLQDLDQDLDSLELSF